MKRVVVTATCLCLIAASAALAATSTKKVTVTPASGSVGTTFTISFLTPSAAPKRTYHVHGQVATSAGQTAGCTRTLDFFNPRKVAANQHVKFAFKLSANQGLCTGRWRVTVKRGGRSILSSAHFTIH